MPNPPRSNKLAFRLFENGTFDITKVSKRFFLEDDYFYAHGLMLLSNMESALRSTRQLWLWRDANALDCGPVTLAEICEIINEKEEA